MAAAETSILFEAICKDFSWSQDRVQVCVKLHSVHMQNGFLKKKWDDRMALGNGTGPFTVLNL